MKKNNEIFSSAITVNLAVLAKSLAKAADAASEAVEIMNKGDQNQAIGTVLDLEQALPDAVSLFNTILILHRNKR